jgi:uncharacterized protein YciI
MKKIATCCIFLFFCLSVYCQSNNPVYDKALAEKLGADEYGMKMYVLVILKTGPVSIDNKETVDSLFKGHMSNIGRMAAAGKLVIAGPFEKNEKSFRGIFILNVKTFEEANKLLAGDPAVSNHLLDAELFEWYGSAAISEYLPFHEKIRKEKM